MSGPGELRSVRSQRSSAVPGQNHKLETGQPRRRAAIPKREAGSSGGRRPRTSRIIELCVPKQAATRGAGPTPGQVSLGHREGLTLPSRVHFSMFMAGSNRSACVLFSSAKPGRRLGSAFFVKTPSLRRASPSSSSGAMNGRSSRVHAVLPLLWGGSPRPSRGGSAPSPQPCPKCGDLSRHARNRGGKDDHQRRIENTHLMFIL